MGTDMNQIKFAIHCVA